MVQAFYILFGAAFTILVAAALGKLLLRGLGLRLYREEEHVLAFLAGAPVLSLLVFACCTAGLARKGVFLGLGIAVLAVAWRSGAHHAAGECLPPLPLFWKRLFYVVFTVLSLVYFTNAMAPEHSPDGTAYHLGVVNQYILHHGFYRITTNMYANLSQGIEMLFLFAFAFGRHSSAALVHFAFLMALPLAMLSYARRSGFGEAGVAGALFLFASPVVAIDGSCAYIDVAVAAIAFGVFYFLQIWDAGRERGPLVLAGLLAGFGYAAKYTAFLAVPYALGFVAWKTWRRRAPMLVPLLVVGICAAVPMLPWVLKNWIWLHNPVSPFLNAVFPNPYVTVGFERYYTHYLRQYDLKSAWEIPLALTVNGRLSGLLGPLFLLSPLALLAARRREGRQLLLALIPFGLPYLGNIGARFVIPALPFLALAMALEAVRIRGLAPFLVVAHCVLSWPGVQPLYARQNLWQLQKILPYREALRIKNEDEFLANNLPGYAVARMIEHTVPRGSAVFTFTPLPEAYTGREILVSYESASNNVIKDILLFPLTTESQPVWKYTFRFPAERLRRVRVVQTATTAQEDNWSIAEFHIFSGLGELPRAPEWRLRAHPNPWDVQMAFDNSPVTRWSSAQAHEAGMFVEVDFSRPETADSVRLECSPDQWHSRLRLDGQDETGRWKTLSAAPQVQDQPPAPGLRHAAIEELRMRGIEYFVVFDNDFGAEDFRKKALVWGIQLAGGGGGGRLYRVP